jgi:hypothetical protein
MRRIVLWTATYLVFLTTDVAFAFSFEKGFCSKSLRKFSAPSSLKHSKTGSSETEETLAHARRSFLGRLAVIPVTTTLLSWLEVEIANASGGATAGGAYLLSAKQRYNNRVKASIQGLLRSVDALKNDDSNAVKAYFEGEDEGSWKDLTVAGYLLSNAFRRNSTAAPDSLPAVKVRGVSFFHILNRFLIAHCTQ